MSALAVVHVLCAVLAVVDAASDRVNTSTTFLRLTASRSDEGIWTARFAEYEISIELKHQAESDEGKELQDSWTLKIRHTSNPMKQSKFKSKESEENENITQENGKRQLWKDVFHITNADSEKHSEQFHSNGKMKKSKSRRQLKSKLVTTTTEATFTQQPEEMTTQATPILKEISQDGRHLEVAFDKDNNETHAGTDIDESFQELDEKTWQDVAAVIFDSTANERNETKNTSVGALLEEVDEEIARLTDTYVLPLIQMKEGVDYVEARERTSGDAVVKDANSRRDEPINEDSNSSLPMVSTNVVDAQEPTSSQIDMDYVIEDSTVREDNEDDDVEDLQDFSAERVPEMSQLTPEMKRILDWFPRSRLLTTENNGYKLFPGVGWIKLVTWPERWSNASRVCESEQAKLAVPDSEEKVRVFLQIFKNYPDLLEQSILQNQVYVGVYASEPDRVFRTVHGTPFRTDFPIWFPDEPDNADPGEDCVTFHSEGKIRDVPCFYNLPFMCQKEPDIS
ncbi:uncharacterized protein [Periplaneta americana]|uniref:uncharacterized protein n=1 Tax=Periplaneta americana TaxID=6978 RepID=UPI0037E9BA05